MYTLTIVAGHVCILASSLKLTVFFFHEVPRTTLLAIACDEDFVYNHVGCDVLARRDNADRFYHFSPDNAVL